MLGRIISLCIGSALVAVILVDVVNTTLVFTNVGGFATNRLSALMWKILPKRGSAANYVGPIIILTIVIFWLLMSWLAWWLIFNGTPDAVVNSQTKVPATLFERFYFVGFNIFTLGIGDFVPGGGIWQLLTILSTGQGFFVVTLAITYILPVISSVTERRQLASQIYAWGDTPTKILTRHWTGGSFELLEDRLLTLLPELNLLEQRNFTYPVLHYFIEDDRRVAIAPNIATLDETLTLVERALKTHPQLSEVIVKDMQQIIGHYLDALEAQYIDTHTESLPEVPLLPLREAGMDVVSQTAYSTSLKYLSKRRSLLAAMLAHSNQEI
jgi:hypothetical protein